MSMINKPLPHRPFSLAENPQPERPPRRQHQQQVSNKPFYFCSSPLFFSFFLTDFFLFLRLVDDIRIECSTLRAGQRKGHHLPGTQASPFGDPLAISAVQPTSPPPPAPSRRLGRPSVIQTQTHPLVLRITFTIPINPQHPVHLRPRSSTPQTHTYRFILAPPLVRYPYLPPRRPRYLRRSGRRPSWHPLRRSLHPHFDRLFLVVVDSF